MKKIKILITCVACIVCLSACVSNRINSAEEPDVTEEFVDESIVENTAELFEIELPLSYTTYSSGTPENAYDSLSEYDETYCTDVVLEGDTVILVVTEEQHNNLIEKFDTQILENLEGFINYNENYSYEITEDYMDIQLYYDEEITDIIQMKVILGVPLACGMHQLLLGETIEWTVHVGIYNCHTGNLVIEYEIPGDSVEFGAEEWEMSYNE